MCSPVFPSQFQYFQRNFVPSFPNSRTKQNLSENLSSIAGYKKPFWQYISCNFEEQNAQNQPYWSYPTKDVIKNVFHQVLLHNHVTHLLDKFISKNVYNWRIIILSNPADIYLLKVNNRNTRTRCEICSKLTINTPESRHWRRSGVFIVNFEHISHLVLVFLLLTWNK